MRPLREYLARFTNLTPPERVIKDVVAAAVKKVCGFIVSTEEIKLSGSKVHLKIDSVRRSEIMLHKAAILREVAETLPGKRIVRDLS